jgi:hypothetical protein
MLKTVLTLEAKLSATPLSEVAVRDIRRFDLAEDCESGRCGIPAFSSGCKQGFSK